ncbi:MAG: class F sortase [Demequinaceae bacterium]|nr:class F sortase [Demequinaceae bacterium]
MNSRIATAAAGGFAAIAVIAATSAITLWPSTPTKDFGADAASVQSSTGQPPDIVAPVTASLFSGTFSSTTQNLSPDRIAIPAVGLDMAVTALGLAPDGSMALNDRADTAAWYKYGAVPGQRDGAALIAAHVASVVDGIGPFSRLADLRQGDTVTVTMSDGSEEPFAVVKRQRISKQEVDYAAITEESPGMLILVTCGGNWDPQNRHYDDNVIVWAASLVP